MPSKILLVDDDREFREEFKECLEDYDVVEAGNGEDALKILKRPNEIDLVILDLMLPAGGGVTVLKSLRGDSRTSGTPVIILTASRSPGYKQKVLDEHVEAYMEKPYDPVELITTIKDLLKKKV